jgi:hypothetical protein
MAPGFDMADPTPTVPFVLAGSVTYWDPVSRMLDISGQCLHVPSSVAVAGLAPNVRVTVTGHRPARGSAAWTVTEIRPHQPGF